MKIIKQTRWLFSIFQHSHNLTLVDLLQTIKTNIDSLLKPAKTRHVDYEEGYIVAVYFISQINK